MLNASPSNEALFTWEAGPAAPLAGPIQTLVNAFRSLPWGGRILIFLALLNATLHLGVRSLSGSGGPWTPYFYEYALAWALFLTTISLIVTARTEGVFPQLGDRFWTASLTAAVALFALFHSAWLAAAFTL